MKLWNNIFNKVSFLVFYFLFPVVSALFEVDICDVGQGNCIIINCPKGHPLLIDAGSSQGRPVEEGEEEEKLNFKQTAVESITSRLKQFLPLKLKSNTVGLTVITTHGDEDHTNWIQEIVENLTNKYSKLKVRFLLGGNPVDYTGKRKIDFKNFAEKHEGIEKQLYISQHLAAGTDPTRINLRSGDVSVKILSALNSTDPNTSSIVLKVKYGHHSVLLTGDATGDTTDSILLKLKNSGRLTKLRSSIVVSSHHGSYTDGSNSIAWALYTSPQYLINSSGTNRKLLHPNPKAVENVIAFSPHIKKNVKEHQFQCSGVLAHPYDGWNFVKDDPLNLQYKIFKTTFGIYNTINQGRISFSWNKDDEDLKEPWCEKNS